MSEENAAAPGCQDLGFGVVCAYNRVLALIFIVFVGVVLIISSALYYLEHWIENRFRTPSQAGLGSALREAVSRVKEEFMITGIISLLLFAFGHEIELATCTRSVEEALESNKGHQHTSYHSLSPGLAVEVHEGGRRRLLQEESSCLESALPFVAQERAHILLLMAALVNAAYSVLTIIIIIKRIGGWTKFETRLHKSAEMQPLHSRTITLIGRSPHITLCASLYRQFFSPLVGEDVASDSYRAARHCAMEYWKLLLCRQMLLKAQDQTANVLQSRVHKIFHPQRGEHPHVHLGELPYAHLGDHAHTQALEGASIDVHKLVHAARNSIERSRFLVKAAGVLSAAERSESKADHALNHGSVVLPKHFDVLYRLKVKEVDYIGLLQRLGAEQFAEDRAMAFVQPLVIGLFLLIPHEARIFAWLPVVVFMVMTMIGWELQRILVELTRRYLYRYAQELPNITLRLRWRRAFAQVVEQHVGERAWLQEYKQDAPALADAAEPKILRRLSERTAEWHRGGRVDSSRHFIGSPKLVQRVFVFCYYSNAFFVAMALYTAWIVPDEFRERWALMLYMAAISIAAMLHGAVNIAPLFALITSSSSHVPAKFTQKLEAEQHRLHAMVQVARLWVAERVSMRAELASMKKRQDSNGRDVEAQDTAARV